MQIKPHCRNRTLHSYQELLVWNVRRRPVENSEFLEPWNRIPTWENGPCPMSWQSPKNTGQSHERPRRVTQHPPNKTVEPRESRPAILTRRMSRSVISSCKANNSVERLLLALYNSYLWLVSLQVFQELQDAKTTPWSGTSSRRLLVYLPCQVRNACRQRTNAVEKDCMKVLNEPLRGLHCAVSKASTVWDRFGSNPNGCALVSAHKKYTPTQCWNLVCVAPE